MTDGCHQDWCLSCLGAIPAPQQHQVLQLHSDTAHPGLPTKTPTQYLRLT